MAEFLSPDIFITEVSTGGRAIQGVGTATGGFIGLAEKGPIGEPVLTTSFEQYIDTFGTFKEYSFLTDSVWGFFLNGGRSCWVSRTANYDDPTTGTLNSADNAKATITLKDRSAGAGTDTLQVDAINEGDWGNNLSLAITEASGVLGAYNRVLGNDGGVFTNNSVSARTPGLLKVFTEVSGTFSDITAALKTAGGGANQVQPSAVGDSTYYASAAKVFSKLYIDLDVSGVAGSGQWQYWNGSAWASFTPASDATTDFTAAPADNLLMEFTAPSDWVRRDINGTTGFYVRYQVQTIYTTPAEISRLTFGDDRPLGVFTAVADPSLEVAGATALDDVLYLGANQRFGFAELDLSTDGDVTGALTWEYWNGSTFVSLQNITETVTGGQHLHASGTVGWTIPTDWAKNDINTETFFWVRARITTNYASTYPTAEHILPQSEFFRILVTLASPSGNIQTEDFDGLTFDSTSANYVEKRMGTTLAPNSRFVSVTDLSSLATPPSNRPRLQIGSRLSGGVYETSNVSDADFIGNSAGATGLFSFDSVDEVNIMTIPGIITEAVQLAMLNYAEGRLDLFTILDSTGNLAAERPQDLVEFVRDEAAFNSSYGAVYSYWLKVSDPINGERKTVPYSGFVAGMYARTDFNRGVWKSPAGEEDGLLRGALGVVRNLSKGERDLLYVNRINPIRDLAGVGVHVDGGKTLASSSSDFSRIAIRRLFLFVEESVQEGMGFVKHEPNDEKLWRRIRASINAFLTALWFQGGLFGKEPQEAFFVICDENNNTPVTINQFVVNVRIGLAPLRPAEFVNITFEVDQRALNEQLASFGLL